MSESIETTETTETETTKTYNPWAVVFTALAVGATSAVVAKKVSDSRKAKKLAEAQDEAVAMVAPDES